MAATKQDIRWWFKAGVKQGATHMIVVCDDFDYEDYPVYVEPSEDVRKKAQRFDGKDMQRIMEVYSMTLPMESQLDEHRAFHWD